MKITEAQEALFAKIFQVFGDIPKPIHIKGFPPEPWQKIITEKDLCDVSQDDFWLAIDHVFPGHYGDVNLLRYLLSGSLYLFVLHEPVMFESQGREIKECLTRAPKSLLKEGFNEVDYAALIIRCLEWRGKLSIDEQKIIGEVIKYRFIFDCLIYGDISPYHFCSFLIWFKNLGELKKIIGELPDDVEIDAFRERGRSLLDGYRHIDRMSAFAALIGAYFADSYHNDSHKWFSSEEIDWSLWGLDYFGSNEIYKIATESEVAKLDKELELFFIQAG